MARHTAVVAWSRGGQDFLGGKYSRAHTWNFDGGAVVPGSSSPHVVPLPQSDAAAVDPEEAYVAALSSCHMLWFLAIAARRKFIVDSYTDHAEGVMEKNAEGKLAITRVVLNPDIAWSGAPPDKAAVAAMHHEAHESCFIANSVKTDVAVAGQ